jgi:hypothetical protein
MESIVSILIFTVLIATVTSMVMVSLRISGDAVDRSTRLQAGVNELLLFDDDDIIGPEDVDFGFKNNVGAAIPPNINAFKVTVYRVDVYRESVHLGSFTAFEP